MQFKRLQNKGFNNINWYSILDLCRSAHYEGVLLEIVAEKVYVCNDEKDTEKENMRIVEGFNRDQKDTFAGAVYLLTELHGT